VGKYWISDTRTRKIVIDKVSGATPEIEVLLAHGTTAEAETREPTPEITQGVRSFGLGMDAQ
jgi:hypothetical protein